MLCGVTEVSRNAGPGAQILIPPEPHSHKGKRPNVVIV
jgi:hypothetical protein